MQGVLEEDWVDAAGYKRAVSNTAKASEGRRSHAVACIVQVEVADEASVTALGSKQERDWLSQEFEIRTAGREANGTPT